MLSKIYEKQTIIVVGGGHAGLSVARPLSAQLDSSKYNIILINPRPYNIILPATIRLSVSPRDNLEESVFVPYDKVFHKNNGEFILDSVTAIEQSPGQKGGIVVLKSGRRIPYHILVLTPGCIWRGPLSFPTNADDVPEFIRGNQNKFKNAKNIVLVGGGSVGIEFSGEIKDMWPEKKVTIVHGDNQLLNDAYPDKFRRAVEKSVTSRGVEFVLNDYVDQQTPANGAVTTRKGKTLKADIVVEAFGSRPNTEFVASLSPDVLTKKGFVNVLPTLQLPSYPNIFAGGDVIEWEEQKQAAKASTHGAVITANIVAYLKDRTLKPYKGSFEMIGITNGKAGGITYLGIVLGNWVTATLKSKGLLIPYFRAQAGY